MSKPEPGPKRPLTDPPDYDVKQPALILPPGSWDCHMHVYGPPDQYPFDPGCPYDSDAATPESYLRMTRILGIARTVLVNGAGYSYDTRYQLETMARYPEHFVGVSYVRESISVAELRELDRRGVRAARFVGGKNPWGHLPQFSAEVARKAADVGWHVEFLTQTVGGMAAEKDRFLALPYTIVLDHFGTLDVNAGLNDPGFTAILALLDTGRVWVKLSNPTISTQELFPYPLMTQYARALVAHAPERMVWATNWPHVVMNGREMPNDGDLVDLIADWIPDERTRKQIMVDNPLKLYGRN